MKKNNKNDLTQEENIISDVILMPVVKPMNPDALNQLGWFMTDANNLRNWAGQLFGSDIDLRNPKFEEIKNAAEIAIKEIEDDIARLKEFLADYVPSNNN